MSLLNDMLKDLDARDDVDTPQHSEGDTPVGSSNRRLRNYLLPVVAGVAALIWVVVELNVFGFFPDISEGALPVNFQPDDDWSSRLKANQKAQVGSVEIDSGVKGDNVVTYKDIESDSSAVVPQDEDLNPLGSTQDHKIKSMLVKAQQLMVEGNIIKPEGDNAYQIFEEVLALDSENTSARQSLSRIRIDILTALNEAEDKKRVNELKRLINDAGVAGVNVEAIRHYTRTLERLTLEQEVEVSDVKADPGVKRSQPESDYDLAKKIREEGLIGLDEVILLRLKNSKNYENTVVALVNSYFSSRDYSALENLKMILRGRDSHLTEFVQAHKSMLENEFDEAIRVLERTQLNGALDIDRIRTLAGLYQYQKDDEKAVTLYRKLIFSRAALVSDWLGFAVVNDRLGRPDNALKAYQKVRELGHPDPNVMNFVATRLRRM